MGLISNGTTVFDAGSMSLGGKMTFIKKLTASSSATLDFLNKVCAECGTHNGDRRLCRCSDIVP